RYTPGLARVFGADSLSRQRAIFSGESVGIEPTNRRTAGSASLYAPEVGRGPGHAWVKVSQTFLWTRDRAKSSRCGGKKTHPLACRGGREVWRQPVELLAPTSARPAQFGAPRPGR